MRSRESTVLVTGGLGYIGSYVVTRLVDAGWKVRIADNRYRSDPAVEARLAQLDGVEIHEVDVRYRGAVDRVMQGCEAVVHFAAVCLNKSISDPTESFDVNLMGTQHVVESAVAHGVRRVIYASSASVYGNPTRLPMAETDLPAPITPYCIAKLAGEHLLGFHAARSGLSWLGLRFFNVYGPGQPTDAYYTSVVLTFLRRLAQGDAPVIDGKGEQSMDFVHVDDVARAVIAALESDATGQVLNVGTGTQTTVKQLAELLIDAVGAEVTPQFRPREVLVTQREADISRITEVLGWTPMVPIDTGIAEVVEHTVRAESPDVAGA